jgi:formyl-CoA transferase
VAPSPLLGEHTEEILRSVLNFSEEQVAEVLGSGATGDAPRIAAE